MTAAAPEFRRTVAEDRVPLARMLELYQHDLSDLWDQDLDAHGEYGYALDRYFGRPTCHAFLARVDGRFAGFALVDDATKVAGPGYWIDQFFVLKKYRCQGLGRAMAAHVFAELPGYWEAGQMTANLPAQRFWRGVIAERTGGRYEEHKLTSGWWQGVVQCFRVDPRR